MSGMFLFLFLFLGILIVVNGVPYVCVSSCYYYIIILIFHYIFDHIFKGVSSIAYCELELKLLLLFYTTLNKIPWYQM